MTLDLFGADGSATPAREELMPGVVVLRRRVLAIDAALIAAAHGVAMISPFRHMTTPGGFTMSVAMTSCGELGW